MRVEDDVKVATVIDQLIDDGDDHAHPVNFAGEMAQLHGIKYTISSVGLGSTAYWAACMSSNPDHLLNPPTLVEIMQSEATYAVCVERWARVVAGSSYGFAPVNDPVQMDLYGLIVPSRQLVCFCNNTNSNIKMRAEIYYSSVFLSQAERTSMALKRGKYRRT